MQTVHVCRRSNKISYASTPAFTYPNRACGIHTSSIVKVRREHNEIVALRNVLSQACKQQDMHMCASCFYGAIISQPTAQIASKCKLGSGLLTIMLPDELQKLMGWPVIPDRSRGLFLCGQEMLQANGSVYELCAACSMT